MAYLVLARKYRPATFSQVAGQEHVTRTLANAFASGRVHHAFLFCGPRGVGKTTLARILGKALNCERGPTSEPCGECSACTTIAAGNAVDYQEMDGASNRGIDAIRELTEAVRYQPAVLRKKVYVIDEVHMLTTEAFNALLKTLEEPPPHVTFVLATTEPHKLPNTILSRCQRYDFKLVPTTQLARHLANIFTTEGIDADAGAVNLIVRESGGSVRDALSLSDQVISYVGQAPIREAAVAEVLGVADRALTRTLIDALARGDAGAALAAADAATERGIDEVQLARALVRALRDLAVVQAAPGRPELVDASDDERAELEVTAGQIPTTRVTQMFERMLRCADDLGKTLQPRLVLDFAMIDLATLAPLVPLGDLLARLGELEHRLGGGGGGGGGGSRGGPVRPTTPAPAAPTNRPGPAMRTEAPRAEAPRAEPARVEAPRVEAVRAEAVRVDAPRADAAMRAEVRVDAPRADAAMRAEVQAIARGEMPAARPEPTRAAPTLRVAPRIEPAPEAPRDELAARRAPDARAAAPVIDRSPPPRAPAGDAPSPDMPFGDAPPFDGEPPSHPNEMPPLDDVPPFDAHASRSARAPAPPNARPAITTERGPDARPAPRPANGAGHASAHSTGASHPAAPAAAHGTRPGGPSDTRAAWAEVLNALEARRKLRLFGWYEQASVLLWTGEALEVGFTADLHSLGEMAREPDAIAEMRAFLAEHLGHPVTLSIKLLDAAASAAAPVKSIVEETRARAAEDRKIRETEAREHPVTKLVLETFGAQIKEIKTDV